jgi:hypothetical protein
MKFQRPLGVALLALTLGTGAAFAQSNTNSGTKTPDETDVQKRSPAPTAAQQGPVSPQMRTNNNSGTKTPDDTDVQKRSMAPKPAPAQTTGSGATNTNSGTKTPDATDVEEDKKPGSATQR